jgi:hypothetical protein
VADSPRGQHDRRREDARHRRDVLAIYQRTKRARDMVSMAKQPELWNELDMAIARIEGMSMFIGPWEPELVAPVRK